jgi:hypothetical protein
VNECKKGKQNAKEKRRNNILEIILHKRKRVKGEEEKRKGLKTEEVPEKEEDVIGRNHVRK